jgi:hypothetical protein
MKLKTLSAAILLSCSTAALAQHDDGHGHAHMGPTVSCTDMATPPWAGLPDGDRQQVASLKQELSAFGTPEAAKAGGFMPVLGDIPGMGTHYVNMAVSMRGKNLDVNTPDQLLFSQDELVGAAYSFTDVPNTQVPLPFDSDLASWHDHPQFARDGETLHMLHVWFVPSSNGPFAGLNFWLPYQTAGIETPNPCWMHDARDADRIRNVSFALVPAQNINDTERMKILDALDYAARGDDHDGWVAAADLFIADLSSYETERMQGMLGVLGENQMSSAERDAAGIAQPRSGRISEAINE